MEGNVFVGGRFKGNVDFDPGTAEKQVSSSLDNCSYVLKLTTDGDFEWVRPFLGMKNSSSEILDLKLDSQGNVTTHQEALCTKGMEASTLQGTLPTRLISTLTHSPSIRLLARVEAIFFCSS